MYSNFKLLVDGKNAFPEIIKSINEAKESILINMFIWRDDEIGNKIAKAILEAANRGVKVKLSVDRYGVVLEKCEESKKSFFHKKINLIEKIKIAILKAFYPMKNTPKRAKEEYSVLYKKIINNKNIVVDKDRFKADHSKYYIIDDEIVFLGGINIEDKENGKDKQGRYYQDYMVKIVGRENVEVFKYKLTTGLNQNEDYFFGINIKENGLKLFEMKKLYLDMINNAKEELVIIMAYFSPLKEFVNSIINAHKRGVKITILTSESANFQDDSNKKTLRKLLKKTNNEIKAYLSPKMVHTKMIINDDYITFGSTNITKKAFKQLSELNLFIKNVESNIRNDLMKSIKENQSLSQEITSYKDIKYNKLMAFVEGVLV